jgi:hypothetical protein
VVTASSERQRHDEENPFDEREMKLPPPTKLNINDSQRYARSLQPGKDTDGELHMHVLIAAGFARVVDESACRRRRVRLGARGPRWCDAASEQPRNEKGNNKSFHAPLPANVTWIAIPVAEIVRGRISAFATFGLTF